MNPTTTSGLRRCWQTLCALLLAAGLAACGAPQSGLDPLAAVAQRGPQVESTLGTQWGEGRESVTYDVEATRLHPEHAQALSQLRYSDETSIRRALGGSADRQLNVLLADGAVEWSVLDGQGQALPVYSQRGSSSYQLAGRHGERYVLVFTNRSSRNYEVAATVDGLDVLSGQAGSLQNAGYLLRAGQTLHIEGFRKNSREVAAFRFATKDRAYAAHTAAGDARNIGVIGAALFEVQLAGSPAAQPPRNGAGAPAPQAFPGDAGRSGYAPPPQYR